MVLTARAANEPPVYCSQCRSSRTWERDSKNDIKDITGVTLWERFKCRICGNTTIRPTGNLCSE